MATFLASLALTEAAYRHMYMGSRPSMALGPRMLTARSGRPSLFSRDIGRVMHNVDEMFNFMPGDLNEMFYAPLPWERRSRPSHLLQGSPVLNALVQRKATSKDLVKNAYGITQDDKRLQIVVNVPDAKAGDINLRLEDNGRLLKVSGETNREEEGISVHSRFERSFMLPRDINRNEISARMDSGVLTITAPKSEVTKENVRRIDIVENEKAESEETMGKRDEESEKAESEEMTGERNEADASASHEKEESQKVVADVPDEPEVIDLDVGNE